MFPIESMYWWKGKIEEESEIVILAKTKEKNYDKIKEEVSKLHSYDVPCILKLSSEANIDYENWVDEVVL